jgi:drug/metabolite transporter (DMT)-like permease
MIRYDYSLVLASRHRHAGAMTTPALTETLAPSSRSLTMGRDWRVPAAVVVVLLAWASAFIAIRFLADSVSPGSVAVGRLVVGSVALAVLALRNRRPLPRGRSLAMVAVYGVLWFAGYSLVLATAEQHLDAGTAALLVNVAPILVAVGAAAFLGEGFPRTLAVGIGVAFVGIVLIAAGTAQGGIDGLGVVLGLLAAVLYASGVLTQKVALRSVDALTATFIGCLIGMLTLLPLLPQAVTELSAAPPEALLTVVYLGLVPTAIGFGLWAFALAHSPAGKLTSTTLAAPAIAVVMSWLILGEVPTALALVGGALALTGVVISRRTPRPRGALSRSAG